MFSKIKSKVADWITNRLIKKYAGTTIRAGIIALGTYIASKKEIPGSEYLSELLLTNVDQYTDKVVGVVLAGVAVIWSYKEKYDTAKDKDVAVEETIKNLAKENTKWVAAVKTKDGVSLHRLKQPALDLLRVVHKVYEKLGYSLVVTATFDGKHMKGSRHYEDLAFDSRVWGIPKSEQSRIRDEVIKALGKKAKDYDIVIESTHIHWEYDPD